MEASIKKITRLMITLMVVVVIAAPIAFYLVKGTPGLWGALIGDLAICLTVVITVAYLRIAIRNPLTSGSFGMAAFMAKIVLLGIILIVGRYLPGVYLPAAGVTFGIGLVLTSGIEVVGLARQKELAPPPPPKKLGGMGAMANRRRPDAPNRPLGLGQKQKSKDKPKDKPKPIIGSKPTKNPSGQPKRPGKSGNPRKNQAK